MPRRAAALGQGDGEERVGHRGELGGGDVEGGTLIRQCPRPDDDRANADVLLDRSARTDADDRADAHLDELVDDDAHRRRAHPTRRAHDRGAAGQRGGEGVEAAVVATALASRSRCSLAMRSDRDGSPLSRAIVVPSSRSPPEAEVVQRVSSRHLRQVGTWSGGDADRPPRYAAVVGADGRRDPAPIPGSRRCAVSRSARRRLRR